MSIFVLTIVIVSIIRLTYGVEYMKIIKSIKASLLRFDRIHIQ